MAAKKQRSPNLIVQPVRVEITTLHTASAFSGDALTELVVLHGNTSQSQRFDTANKLRELADFIRGTEDEYTGDAVIFLLRSKRR